MNGYPHLRLLFALIFLAFACFDRQTLAQVADQATPKIAEESSPLSATNEKAGEAAASPTATALNEPLVARVEMRLTLGDKVVDIIEKGDLLTLVSERDDAYVIRTFNGHRGAVDKVNAVKLAEAIDVYNDLIAADDKQGRTFTLRASAWWALGKHEKALADFNQAIELGYREANAYSSRGIFRAATGQHAEAIEDFTAALAKDPRDTASLINRAAAYMALGQPAKAVEDYTAAIALDEKNAVLLQQRAIAYKADGKLDAALTDFERALAIEPKDVAAWMGRGFIYFQQGKHAQAVEDFSRVLELAPETAVAFNNRGYNYQQLGKWKEALADFDKAVELAPQYGLAWQNKAWLYVLSRDEPLRDAKAAVAAAQAACELTTFENANDLLALAAALAADKQFEKAIGWQEKVIELLPEDDRTFAKKILARYQQQEPFDPQLLQQPANETRKKDESKPEPPKSSQEQLGSDKS